MFTHVLLQARLLIYIIALSARCSTQVACMDVHDPGLLTITNGLDLGGGGRPGARGPAGRQCRVTAAECAGRSIVHGGRQEPATP